ncbi:MAG TPA: hypothetical protein DHV28_00470 [Ignavibacteriales bacterium]|nr:hypothetical protein [Ignavibacteriales bacterium]
MRLENIFPILTIKTDYNMIKTCITFLALILTLNLFAQDKRYTHDSENGYMWQDFEKRMIARDLKYDFLSAMLDNQKLKKLSGNYESSLGCEIEMGKVQNESKNNFDLHLIVKMIDNFYSTNENLIIPINYAYCYCIKELAGYKSGELESYRLKLINFSKLTLEQ